MDDLVYKSIYNPFIIHLFHGKSIYKWMIWGQPYSRKPPYHAIKLTNTSWNLQCNVMTTIYGLTKKG